MSHRTAGHLCQLSLLVGLAYALGACGDGASYSDRLVLASGTRIDELPLAAKHIRQIVAGPAAAILTEPAVSPDGSRIAYVQLLTPTVIPGQPTDLGGDLYIANADGSNPKLVLQHAVRNEQIHSPAWLPDGKALLVSVYDFETRQVVTTVERLNLTTGELTPLIQSAYQATISRDGLHIAFVRTQPDYTLTLWEANADGSAAQQIAGAAQGLASIQCPRFSPDGRYLVFGGAGQGENLRRQVAPDAAPQLVVASTGAAAGAGAEPVLFNGWPEDIWILDLTTHKSRRLADLKLDSPSLAWSSDGRRLFVYGDRGLYVINPKSGSTQRIGEGQYHGQMDWLAAK